MEKTDKELRAYILLLGFKENTVNEENHFTDDINTLYLKGTESTDTYNFYNTTYKAGEGTINFACSDSKTFCKFLEFYYGL